MQCENLIKCFVLLQRYFHPELPAQPSQFIAKWNHSQSKPFLGTLDYKTTFDTHLELYLNSYLYYLQWMYKQ